MDDYDLATALPSGIEHEPKIRLAGFESLYEITQSGQLYSVRAKRFIKRAHLEQAYLRAQVDGVQHNLNIKESVSASWAQAKARLYRVEIPASVVVVLARDVNEARALAADGFGKEVKDRRVRVTTTSLDAIQDVRIRGKVRCHTRQPA